MCPFCQTHLSGHGTRERLVRLRCGLRVRVCVPVGICPHCGHSHTELPHFIRPYKHYASSVIEDVVDGRTLDTCEADESTMRRWLAEHQQTAPHVETLLRAVQTHPFPLFGASLLTYLRQTHRHWSAFVTPLLCAAQFFPCTQFACCPGS